jgi:carboxypeptidase-like protein
MTVFELRVRAWRIGVACIMLAAPARHAIAQGEISGRVVAADSGRPPVQGAEATIAKLGRSATSDSSGRFRFRDMPSGEHVLVLRAVGFKSESSKVFIDRDEVVSAQVVMRRTTTDLPERVVTAPDATPPAKLVEFMERQKTGVGHFITREQLARAEGGVRRTGDVIATIPGVVVRRGSNKIWIASGRTKSTGCAFPDPKLAAAQDCGSPQRLDRADSMAGARPACFMDVYVDGALVFDSRNPQFGLFDANSIPPEHIAGIEVYSSTAQIPAKYNRTSAGCGVLLIWTR